MECISYLFSQECCVPSQPAPRERTPGDCVSEPLAWPGCSVLAEGWGGLTVALWLFGVDRVALLSLSGLPHCLVAVKANGSAS